VLIIGSPNTECGLMAGLRVLECGGSAVDAVEQTLRVVEEQAGDGSVGLGGLPNILGQVELDASIMDGRNLAAGAVAALQGFLHPISVARRVMELLPHVLLVGQGAFLFAQEIGAERAELLTERGREELEMRLCAVSGTVAENEPLYRRVQALLGFRPGGTACAIAVDAGGHICTGVTTSGWAFKYPGRVGDSPLIGAGNYADDRYGAAACTGIGEAAIRIGAARSVVLRLSTGQRLDEALWQVMQEARRLKLGVPLHLNIYALSESGEHALCSTSGERAHYLCAYPGDREPRRLPALPLAALGDAPACT
jgi:beta-aspartyl-peptidase (threonine type)